VRAGDHHLLAGAQDLDGDLLAAQQVDAGRDLGERLGAAEQLDPPRWLADAVAGIVA